MVFERLAKPWGAILSGSDSQVLRQQLWSDVRIVKEQVLNTCGGKTLGG